MIRTRSVRFRAIFRRGVTALAFSTLLGNAALSPQLFGQDQPATQAEPTPKVVRLPGVQDQGEILLPTGWSVNAVGSQLNVGDFPTHIVFAPDQKYMAVLHSGYGDHEIIMVDIEKKSIASRTILPQLYYGLTFSADGKQLFASGAEFEVIYSFDYAEGALSNRKELRVVPQAETFVPCGITPMSGGKELLTCGVLGHKLARMSTDGTGTPKLLELPEGSYPYVALLDSKEKLAYVSLWGGSAVAVVDLEAWKVTATWPTRSHPCEMKLIHDGKFLLVSCSNDNSIVVIDTTDGSQKEVITTALYPNAKNGSTPSSLTVSPDEKVVLASNSDNNNVAAFDISEPGRTRSLGFLPAGWYPTNVRFTPDGKQILIANGKGLTSRPNSQGPAPGRDFPRNIRQYIGGLFQGAISFVPTPTPDEMAKMTRTAMASSPLKPESAVNNANYTQGNAIPAKVGDPSPIKHCFYIIKENRTYDQVFGDLPQGNGDPNLCLFPERVTPNHHALVSEFVILDNFYVESEVSADGHEWTMAGYATDFVEKSWPMSYRGGGKDKFTYPSEGKLKIAEPTSGYIWDACKKAGVDYFSFGEFINNGATSSDPATTNVAALQGHFDPLFRSYDLEYTDVKRAERFIERFRQFEAEDNLPGLVIMRLPNDHTSGTRPGKPTPTAMVADNDLALGMVVEAISKSKYWKESAIFVIEDDAQNGADHVDAHRTVALAISPYVRKGTVDSELYSTASHLRTMELMLGIEPMTQFDAAATPLYSSFQATPDLTPYTARPAQVDLNEKNQVTAWGAKLSLEMDLSREDAADDLLLGDIVWRSVKGADSPMPAPVRAAFVFNHLEEEDEEEELEEEERKEEEGK